MSQDTSDAVITTELKPWEPDAISPRHRQALLLLAAGRTVTEAAEATGFSIARLSVVKNSPEGAAILARMTSDIIAGASQDVQARIQGTALEAFEKVKEVMRTGKEENALRSAFDILDRAGFKPREVQIQARMEVKGDAAGELLTALREARQPVTELPMVESTDGVFVVATGDEDGGEDD